MAETYTAHTPVLKKEVCSFIPKNPHVVVDGTIGGGGHAEAILKTFPSLKAYLGLDQDAEAIERANNRLAAYEEKVRCLQGSYEEIPEFVKALNLSSPDAILLDLGFSSDQITGNKRGFSFQVDEPLDMRYDSRSGITAEELLAKSPREKLASILREYGEEPQADRIAHAIASMRKVKPIKTTLELSDIIVGMYRKILNSKKEIPWIGGLHPSTRTFQAIRIAVNDELKLIERSLPKLIGSLRENGRLLVITFHSLEDRIVKQYFKHESRNCICPPEFPTCVCGHRASLRICTKKAVVPSDEEIALNPKSRSAKLRVAEKI